MTQAPDRIWIDGALSAEWRDSGDKCMSPHGPYIRATPTREAAPDLLIAAKMADAVMSEWAAKVGPQHAWWDVIFDIRAAIAKAKME